MDAPAELGRYALLRPYGGAGDRRLAFDPTLDRTLVLEIADARDGAPDALRRARAFAAVDHPAFAAIHDVSVIDGHIVLAREHVVGRPFSRWCGAVQGAAPIVSAIVQVGRALAAIHGAGLVVGNLGADTVVVGADGRPSIAGPVLDVADGSVSADRAALCGMLDEALRAARVAPPRHLVDLDAARFASTDELVRWLARDPASHRRRALFGLGAVLVVATAIFAYVEARNAALLVCRGADRKLVGVWDSEVSARLHRAFEATAAPFADHVAGSLDGELERWAGEWTGTHTLACEAARVHGGSELELDARMRCLEGRLDALGELVAVLEAADDTVVRNALAAAQALEPPASCLDARPSTSESPEEERRVRRELARALALQGAGKYREAFEVAEQVRATAESRADDVLWAESLRLVGTLHWQLGEARRSDEAYEACIGRAWVARRDDVAAFAWSQLVFVRAELLADFPGAHRAAHHADAALARVGDDPVLAGAIHMSRGTLAYREGRYRDAIVEHEASLAAYRRSGADELRIASVLGNLANAQLRADRLDDALRSQTTALEARTRLLGDVHPETALNRETLAGILSARGDSEAALAEFRRVHEIRARTLGPHHPFTLNTLGNVGATLTDVGRWDEAGTVLEQALEDTRRYLGRDAPNVFFLLYNLSLVRRQRGDHSEALRLCEEAERLVETPDHPNAAVAITCQARALLGLGRPDEGISRFRTALDIRDRKLGPEHEQVARTLGELGTALLDHPGGAARRDEGIALLRRSLEIHRRRGSLDALVTPVQKRLDAALGARSSPGDREGPGRGTGEGETP